MVTTRIALVGLMLAVSAGSNLHADTGWKAANQAMGEALKAEDGKAAYDHGMQALRLYMKAGAPSEQTLVNLAINVADISLSWKIEQETSIREIRKIVTHLEAKGSGTALNRLYLHNALLSLAKYHGKWDKGVQAQLMSIISATEEAYGPDHPALAYAHVEYARYLQRMMTRGVATNSLKAARRIADGLSPDNPNRPAILRMLAMYDIEGRRYSEAIAQLEEALTYLAPAEEKQAETWRQVMGTLAAAYARRGEWEKTDSAVAQIIANTKTNNAPITLVAWMPEPLENWNERDFVTTAKAHFDIGPDGRATNIRGEYVEGSPQYPAYAADAMKKWRWVPVIRDGVAELSAGHSETFSSVREREARTGSRLP